MGGVKVKEQHTQAKGERQDDADGDVAATQAFAEQSHHNRRRQRKTEQPPEWTCADEHRACRSGKSDVRQGMAGKGEMAEDEEKSYRTGDDRDQAARHE